MQWILFVLIFLGGCTLGQHSDVCKGVPCVEVRHSMAAEAGKKASRSTILSTIYLRSDKAYRYKDTFYRTKAIGCGVVIAPGKVLTANHVVRDNEMLYGSPFIEDDDGVMRPRSGPSLEFDVVDADEQHDMALLRMNTDFIQEQPIMLASHDAVISQKLWLMGCRTGWTKAVVTDVHHDVPPVGTLTEIDVFSQSGDSGGPVVDEYGKLVGMYIAGSQPLGKGYFIPVSRLREFLND